MLTFLKQIFIWWNQQTLATRIQTIFFGKFVGVDNFGNKYYESKAGKRWVIYKNEIDALKKAKIEIKGLAHITGDGYNNVNRILPDNLNANIRLYNPERTSNKSNEKAHSKLYIIQYSLGRIS